jgi:hypothetical protein
MLPKEGYFLHMLQLYKLHSHLAKSRAFSCCLLWHCLTLPWTAFRRVPHSAAERTISNAGVRAGEHASCTLYALCLTPEFNRNAVYCRQTLVQLLCIAL